MTTPAPPPRDPFYTDTADPARVFRQMFPPLMWIKDGDDEACPPPLPWQLFSVREDLRLLTRKVDSPIILAGVALEAVAKLRGTFGRGGR